MSEIAVSKKTSESPALRRAEPSFGPLSVSPFALNPFRMMREFTNDMDRLFRGNGAAAEAQAWAPAMDVQQCNGNLVVCAELPGMKKEDIKVEVDENILTIQGERKQEHKQDHEGYHLWERNYGRFYRAVALPEGAKGDQVKAELKDGVLKVSVAVAEAAKKARQIPVAG